MRMRMRVAAGSGQEGCRGRRGSGGVEDGGLDCEGASMQQLGRRPGMEVTKFALCFRGVAEPRQERVAGTSAVESRLGLGWGPRRQHAAGRTGVVQQSDGCGWMGG